MRVHVVQLVEKVRRLVICAIGVVGACVSLPRAIPTRNLHFILEEALQAGYSRIELEVVVIVDFNHLGRMSLPIVVHAVTHVALLKQNCILALLLLDLGPLCFDVLLVVRVQMFFTFIVLPSSVQGALS